MIRPLLSVLLLSIALSVQAAGPQRIDRTQGRELTDPARQRQPTVVALWSLECSHCKKNLQLLGRLAKANPALRVITVAAEPGQAAHAPMLDRHALAGPRYAYGSDAPEAIAFGLDPDWAGELPRSFLFDGKGGSVKRSGVLTQTMVEQATGLRF